LPIPRARRLVRPVIYAQNVPDMRAFYV